MKREKQEERDIEVVSNYNAEVFEIASDQVGSNVYRPSMGFFSFLFCFCIFLKAQGIYVIM